MAEDLLFENSEGNVAEVQCANDDMIANIHKKGIEKMKTILKFDSNKGLHSRFNWGVLAGGHDLSEHVEGNEEE